MIGVLRKLSGSLAGQGFVGTLRLILKNIVHEWRWWLDRSIDRRLGTDTSGQISLDTLSIDSANTAHGVYYEPTPTQLLRRMFNNVRVDRRAFHLVDLGSGKGRVLLVAATSGFAATNGIEFARELHAVAQKNAQELRARFPKAAPMTCVCGDAEHFDFPLGDLVIFAYNPFEEPVMKEVMQRLEESLTTHPRRVVLIYYNDRPEAVGACRSLRRRAGLELPFDRTRVVQRPAAIYSNFVLEAGPDWSV